MITVHIPRLLGSKGAAAAVVAEVCDGARVHGEDVCVMLRDNMAVSQTAVIEIVDKLLNGYLASRVLLRAASKQHTLDFEYAAQLLKVEDQVALLSAGTWHKIETQTRLQVACICLLNECECGARQRGQYLRRTERGT